MPGEALITNQLFLPISFERVGGDIMSEEMVAIALLFDKFGLFIGLDLHYVGL